MVVISVLNTVIANKLTVMVRQAAEQGQVCTAGDTHSSFSMAIEPGRVQALRHGVRVLRTYLPGPLRGGGWPESSKAAGAAPPNRAKFKDLQSGACQGQDSECWLPQGRCCWLLHPPICPLSIYPPIIHPSIHHPSIINPSLHPSSIIHPSPIHHPSIIHPSTHTLPRSLIRHSFTHLFTH